MKDDKILIGDARYFNAKNIEQFINTELKGELNLIKPNSVNNVFDFSEKFKQERNASYKFCIYGLIQSKWGNCQNLKIDFKIGNSSTNIIKQQNLQNDIFWIYDRSLNQSATTWSFLSRPLDSSNGNLSKNIYGKIKANYFFPFEIDLENLIKINNINVNKSIYLNVLDVYKNLYLNFEVPFLFFDDEGQVLEFGQETAEILDDGDVLEINNNYPFFYDRHWIRREIEPQGPNSIFFTEESKIIQEGGSDSYILEDKIIPIQISMSGPSKSGMEYAKIEVLYGQDDNNNEYTTVRVPDDLLFNTNYVSWDTIGEGPIKTFNIKMIDDFFVEPKERLTLKITPIFGLMLDNNKSQIMSIYFEDNDKPSNVFFAKSFSNFTEPRQDSNAVSIPIEIKLNTKLLVDNQYVDVYIDREDSDCKSTYGFNNLTGNTFLDSYRFYLNKNDLSYSTNLMFVSKKSRDIERKIVLRFSGFSSNVNQLSLSPQQLPNYTIYVNKDIDDDFVYLNIPYDIFQGYGVLRNIYNVPNASYLYSGQSIGNDFTTKLSLYNIIDSNNSIIPNYSAKTSNIKQLTFETDFKITIRNNGKGVVFDNVLYKNGEDIVINFYSGLTTNVSGNSLNYDGKKFKIKLPSNDLFVEGSQSWGFKLVNYEMSISNNTYNYVSGITLDNTFYDTNLLTNNIKLYNQTTNLLNKFFIVDVSKKNNKANYNLVTVLKNTNSQIDFDDQEIEKVNSYSANTLEYTTNNLYFNGAIILPKPYYGISQKSPTNLKKSTFSDIFFTKNIPLDVNELLSVNNNINSIGYLPVSDILLKYPFTSQTKFVKYSFGNLFVQSGYFNLNINSVSTDAFIAKRIYPNQLSVPSNGDFNSLLSWEDVGLPTKIGAVIEIQNSGIVSINYEGHEVGVGEKIWITESPLTNEIQGVVNIVRPFNNLNLILPTNSNYKKNILSVNNNGVLVNLDVFLNAKYKISFLNFKIYNLSNVNTGKIFNYSFNTNDRINYILNPLNNSISFQETKKFLRTVYNSDVLVNKNLVGFLQCNPNFPISNAKQLASHNFEVRGVIATSSNDSYIIKMNFVDSDSLKPIFCNANGISWAKN